MGSSQTFTIAPDNCHSLSDVVVDGASVGPVTSYTFTNVAADHTIAASFTGPAYTITASAGAGGSITPSGVIPTPCGADVAFAIAASPGYHVADVVVDGFSSGALPGFTFTDVQANHEIAASFAANPPMTFVFEPHDLNMNSNAAYVTGYLTPGAPYSPLQIEATSIRLNGSVLVSPYVTPSIENGTMLKVKFARTQVVPTLVLGEQVPVTVTGTIAGLDFAEADSIKVNAAKLSAPAPGATLVGLTTASLAWNPLDAPTPAVSVVSSFDDGVTWSIEAPDVPNTGGYDWSVPQAANSQVRLAVIQIYAVDETGIVPQSEFAVSDAFSIQPTLGAGANAARFALRPVNPVTGPLTVSFSLASDAKATLKVYDVGGRCTVSREVGAAGSGWHVVSLGALPSGVYVMRLSQSGRSITSRVAVVR